MKVRDLLTFGGLASAKIAAGTKGLNRPISGASVLEIMESGVSRWLQPNELYITSFYAVRENTARQCAVIKTLYKSGCSALALCHIGHVLKTLDASIIQLCDHLKFPLIIADPGVTYSEIIKPVILRLVPPPPTFTGTMPTTLRREVAELLATTSDSYEVFKSIAAIYKIDVTFFDSTLQCTYSNKPERHKEKEIAFIQQLGSHCLQAADYAGSHTKIGRRPVYIKVMRSAEDFLGGIILSIKNPSTQSLAARIADELTAPCSITLRQLRHKRTDRLVDRYEYITDLVAGNFPTLDKALSRGKSLGYTISDKNILLLFNLSKTLATKATKAAKHNFKARLASHIFDIVQMYNQDNIVAIQEKNIIALIEDRDKQLDINKLCTRLTALLPPSDLAGVFIGYSNWFRSPNKIPEAYSQASQAAAIGWEIFSNSHFCSYNSIRLLHILKTMQQEKDIIKVCEEVFLPLAEHDKTHSSDLLLTLQTMLNTNMNMAQAAEQLFIHRNTLQYRRKKIEETLGYNPFTMPHLLNIIMANYICNDSKQKLQRILAGRLTAE